MGVDAVSCLLPEELLGDAAAQVKVHTSQEALSTNALAAYSYLQCIFTDTLKKAAVSCGNISTQSFLASVNLELSMNDLPSHSGLFKVLLFCCRLQEL